MSKHVNDRWSPMKCLPLANLTASGLLELDNEEGEVEVLTRDSVELRIATAIPLLEPESGGGNTKSTGKWTDRDSALICTLTTHRIVFQENAFKQKQKKHGAPPTYIDLCLVNDANSSGGLGFSSPKIKMSTHAFGEVVMAFESGSDRDQVLSSLHKCLSRKAWLESVRSAQKKRNKGSNKVGVDAIISKNKERHEDAKRISEAAFSSDVEGLMVEAKDLVDVINKYVATLEKKQRGEKNGSAKKTPDDDDDEKLADMLRSMGMMTAITKSSAGTLFHQQLARQLADFLRKSDRLNRAGGMLTLTDVYCLFNRARGTNLISPDDMIEVVDLMSALHLGFSKRTFPSGVMVIQSDEHDDKVMSKRLQEFASRRTECSKRGEISDVGGVTALETSRFLKTPAVLALEQLQSAEKLGYLCRDSTLEGLRFFPNKFISVDW